jgi:hypothetical protein
MLEGRGDRVPGARSDLCVCLDCCFAVFAGLCGERVLVYKYCDKDTREKEQLKINESHTLKTAMRALCLNYSA